MHNVKDFGAVGDGKTLDTAAIQAAIDAGGMVLFPPGVYLSGTLFLRSNGGLNLEPGAVILASPDKEDYNRDDFSPDNHIYETEAVSGAHLIIGHNVENVTICGGGRIDGNRGGFYELPENIVCGYETIDWRPAQMIFFLHCSRISLSGVELTNSPYWSCFLCDVCEAQVHALRIKNPMATPNGDGLDLENCKKVTVSDCIIETGDDCIAIRSTTHFGCKEPVTENIVITNCILTTVCNAVRIGVADGTIRNILMNNCSIIGSRTGFCICTQYWENTCCLIEDCRFTNLQIEASRPFSLHSNAWGRTYGAVTKKMQNLVFAGIYGSTDTGNLIDAYDRGDICNITFDDVNLTCSAPPAGTVLQDEDFDFTERTDNAPACAWLVRNAENITFRNCKVAWKAPLPPFDRELISVNSDINGGF